MNSFIARRRDAPPLQQDCDTSRAADGLMLKLSVRTRLLEAARWRGAGKHGAFHNLLTTRLLNRLAPGMLKLATVGSVTRSKLDAARSARPKI
jgi:hypothetical protein